MRVLFLTSDASEESKEIARALTNYLSENKPEVIFRTIDVLKTIKSFKAKLIKKGYSFLCKNLNKFSIKLYKKSTLSTKDNYEKTMLYKLTKSSEKILLNQIDLIEPDVIISCHSIASNIVCHIKSTNPELFKNKKLYCIIPKFSLPMHAKFKKLANYIVLANEKIEQELIKFGVNSHQEHLTFGIPTNIKFNEKVDKIKACEKLRLSPETFQLLCYIPNYTFTQAKSVLRNLSYCKTKIHITMFCVKNNKLCQKLNKYIKRKKIKHVKALGITNNFNLYLSTADLVLCNPKGLIIAKCANKGVPVISTPKLSLDEKANFDMLNSEKAILGLEDFSFISETIDELAKNTELKNSLIQNIKNIAKPNATQKLCDHICKNK